jgi:HPt (histidine-containing phosphotransfer) domain-containing protein
MWIMDTGGKYDLSFLNKISNGDQDFILDMIRTFKSTAPVSVQKMKSLLKEKKYESISREAHRVIPGISFLGVKYIEENLMKIEDYSKKKENLEQLMTLILLVEDNINQLILQFNKDFNLT